jgi:hypothetical protein
MNCRKCGIELETPEKRGKGRPRTRCEKCSPSTIHPKMPNSTNLGPIDPMDPHVTAEDIAPGIQVWTSKDERREALAENKKEGA